MSTIENIHNQQVNLAFQKGRTTVPLDLIPVFSTTMSIALSLFSTYKPGLSIETYRGRDANLLGSNLRFSLVIGDCETNYYSQITYPDTGLPIIESSVIKRENCTVRASR